MNIASNNKLSLMKLKPLWLREKLFWKLYGVQGDFEKKSEYLKLFENAKLQLAHNVFLKLLPTDISHKAIAYTGFYELAVSRRIANLAKAGGLMVDVGANYGYYSCLWAAANDKNKVFAFEASPKNLSALKLNIQRNNFGKQIDVYDVALGKETGVLPFILGSDEQTGWGGLLAKNQDGAIEVPVMPLDNFLVSNDIEHVDVLKIDTEGADTWVLQGAEKSLRAQKFSNVFFEENLPRMSALGIKPGEAQNLLQTCGYHVESLGEGEWYARI